MVDFLKPAPSITEGLLVFVQLVMAAITTDPWERVYSLSSNINGTFFSSMSPATLKPGEIESK